MNTPVPGEPSIDVLLVDDDPLVRTGLRMMLGGAPDLRVVGEIEDGAGVWDAVGRLAPDVVLMDIRMPMLDGIDATRALASAGPQAPAVIVLTTFDSDANVLAAMRAGAAGFLLKHTAPEQIVAAVRCAAAGEPALSPSVARKLMDYAAAADGGADNRRRQAAGRLAQLSGKERQVAVAVAQGWSNAEIAAELLMSVGTVKAHVSSALTKLELTNRIQLALLAHDAGEV